MSIVKQFAIGSIVRYSGGITALMKVETVAYDEDGEGNHHYHGQQFYGGAMGAHHDDMRAAKPDELALWDTHWKKEELVKAARVALTAIDEALRNVPGQKDSIECPLKRAKLHIYAAVEEAQR